VRGEYQITARLYRQAKEGNPEALRAFWTMAEAAAARAEALGHYIDTPQTRRAFGNRTQTPRELWGTPRRRDLPAAEAWRLLPVKAAGAVRGGVYECTVDHYPVSFRFMVSGTPGLPALDYGHRVFAAFDPARPHMGCHLFNAEPKSGRSQDHGRRVNREGFGLLEPLGVAAYWPDAPQENYAPQADTYAPQKKAASALRSEFTTVFRRGASAALVRKSKATDAFGRHVSHGTPLGAPEDTAPPAAPAPRPAREAPAAALDLVSLHRAALPARAVVPQSAEPAGTN
jgi:hypothetical protein